MAAQNLIAAHKNAGNHPLHGDVHSGCAFQVFADQARAEFAQTTIFLAKSRGLVVKNRDQLARKMTPEQLAAARQLAREWRPAK